MNRNSLFSLKKWTIIHSWDHLQFPLSAKYQRQSHLQHWHLQLKTFPRWQGTFNLLSWKIKKNKYKSTSWLINKQLERYALVLTLLTLPTGRPLFAGILWTSDSIVLGTSKEDAEWLHEAKGGQTWLSVTLLTEICASNESLFATNCWKKHPLQNVKKKNSINVIPVLQVVHFYWNGFH